MLSKEGESGEQQAFGFACLGPELNTAGPQITPVRYKEEFFLSSYLTKYIQPYF